MSKLIQAVRMLKPKLRVHTLQGEPFVAGERQVVPVAQSIQVTLGGPGAPFVAGYVWSRPVAVLETWRGQTRRLPIHDLTRTIRLLLVASSLILALAARYLRQKQKMQGERDD